MRNFCFTLNNYDALDVESIKKHRNFSYGIFGHEIAPSTNTRHLQGYIELEKRQEFNVIKKMYPWHIEERKGSQKQAIEYCKKSGNFEEFGIKKKAGQRNDLDNVRKEADEEGMRAVTRNRNLQQIRIAEKYLTYNENKRNWKPEVTWLWGEPGAGKTRKALEMTNDPYIKNNNSKWFDGYDKHEDLIIDDIRKKGFFRSLNNLLGLLDRYPFQVEVKGGYRQILAKKIIITSVENPETFVKRYFENGDQLMRRIDKVMQIDKSQG